MSRRSSQAGAGKILSKSIHAKIPGTVGTQAPLIPGIFPRDTLIKGLPSIPRREDTSLSGARIDLISVSLD
ncbi:MAG: hypothetical protein II828_06540 [Clostridia bacterium]|nr:hypothetical protein [Clostridia bacterium]